LKKGLKVVVDRTARPRLPGLEIGGPPDPAGGKQLRRPRLSRESRALERHLVAEYSISDAAGLAILRVAMEALDRMRACQRQIAADGATSRDRFNQVKGHPLLAVERDARAQYLAALKQMSFDVEPLRAGPGRPGG
jgi:hypothetical protein